MPDVDDSFMQLMEEAADLSFVQMGGRRRDRMASFAHKQIAGEGENITGEINEQMRQMQRSLDKLLEMTNALRTHMAVFRVNEP